MNDLTVFFVEVDNGNALGPVVSDLSVEVLLIEDGQVRVYGVIKSSSDNGYQSKGDY